MRIAFQRCSGVEVQNVPRHPEVDQESPTGFEPNNQILAAAIDRGDVLALQLGSDLDRVERARQPRVGNLDTLEGAPDQPRLEPATDGLDFRELGHRTRVVAAARWPRRSGCVLLARR
jgi:hypothetical protein